MSELNQNPVSLQQGQSDEEQNIQLADLWTLIWDHKWWYVFSILLFLFLAVFHLYKTPKTYSRVLKVIVDEDTQNSMMRDLTAFASSRYRFQSGTNVDNEMEAFASPDLMERVVSRLGLETSYVENQFMRTRELYKNTPVEMVRLGEGGTSSFSFVLSRTGDSTVVLKDFMVAGKELDAPKVTGHLGDSLSTPIGSLRLLPTPALANWNKDITVSWVRAAIRAKSYCGRLSVAISSKQSSVLVLTMSDVFPNRAESVLSALLDVYNEEWVENRNRSVRNTSVFINDRLGVIERELGGIENDLKSYKQSHQIANIQLTGTGLMQQSSTYSAQAFATSNQLAIARMIKEFINDPKHANDLMPANSGLEGGNVEPQIAEYNKALLERDRALALSSENNPLVQDLNNTLDRLRLAINRSIDNLISTLQLEVNKIEDKEKAILSRVSNTSGQELELLSIERQQKVKEQLYIFLLQKREENELQSLLTVGNTRLIMKPNGGSSPIAPNKMMILLVALVLGFGLPFAVFYVLKVLDTTVKGRNDLGKLNIPFLAEIPQMGLKGGYWHRMRVNLFDNSNTRIVVEPGHRDMMNEAFRVLRTNLDLMAHSVGEAHNVMVTSFNPNAGKTFTLLNLAASMALKGSRVIILDLDLRKATLSKALGKNSTGVSAFLNGKYDNVFEHIQKITDNLDLMTVGSIPANPAELLVSERFDRLLDELKGKYDYVFMDCPPVDLVADTSIIAAKADITIFIIRAGLFDKRALPAVDQMYTEGRYNRMAIILNGVDTYARKKSGYGYGYGNEDDE